MHHTCILYIWLYSICPSVPFWRCATFPSAMFPAFQRFRGSVVEPTVDDSCGRMLEQLEWYTRVPGRFQAGRVGRFESFFLRFFFFRFCTWYMLYTLPETNSSHLEIGRAPKGKDRLPTTIFQVLWKFQGYIDTHHSTSWGPNRQFERSKN